MSAKAAPYLKQVTGVTAIMSQFAVAEADENNPSRVKVISSLNDLPAPNKIEQRVIDRLDFDPSIRLACQLRPEKNIHVNPLISLMSSEKKKLKYDNQERLTGLEKDAVIMFCDLRGFTTLSEGKMPFDVVFILNKYFKLVTKRLQITEAALISLSVTGDGDF